MNDPIKRIEALEYLVRDYAMFLDKVHNPFDAGEWLQEKALLKARAVLLLAQGPPRQIDLTSDINELVKGGQE